MDRMMNLLDTVDGVIDIMLGGPGIFFDMLNTAAMSHRKFYNALQTVMPNGLVKGTIPIPESLANWLHRKTDGVASSRIVSEVIGTIATNFMARAVGMETVSLKLAYHGIDAIYRFPIKGIDSYVIAESKGGNSRLSMTNNGKQMHDAWIDRSISDLVRANQGVGLEFSNLQSANIARTPILAVIVKLNMHRKNPEYRLCDPNLSRNFQLGNVI